VFGGVIMRRGENSETINSQHGGEEKNERKRKRRRETERESKRRRMKEKRRIESYK